MRKTILILIFTLAFILRFFQLGFLPPSLDWDEVSLGYNAYSILKTSRDEYGNFLPLSIRSFGDYKPPLYTYLTTIPVVIWGLNEFSTRFISALFGSLSIIIGYFLVKELFPSKSFIFYLLSLLFFAVSPWHIQFSRVAFEANSALLFFLTGIWLFLKGTKEAKYFPLSFLFFAATFYTYHSSRLVTPLFLFGATFVFRKEIWQRKIFFMLSVIFLLLLVLPLFFGSQSGTAARFGSVTVINPDERLGPSIKAIEMDSQKGDLFGKLMHNRRIVYAREILAGYLDHFNFDFLFLTGDPPGRHHAVGMGMLYWWDLPFIVIGVFYLLRQRNRNSNLFFFWFLIAPVASSLTTGTPHAVRALLYLPTYQIFTAFGVVEFMQFLKTRFNPVMLNNFVPNLFRDPIGTLKRVQGDTEVSVRDDKRMIYKNLIVLVTFPFFIFNFFYYLHMYYIHTPIEESLSWQYGYKEVVAEVKKLEGNYGKIIVTYRYDQPYIYFLFYNKIDPSWYQQNWGGGEIKRAERKFGKYEFRNLSWEKDSQLANILLVGTPGEIPDDASGIVKEIKFLDGSVAFRIVAR